MARTRRPPPPRLPISSMPSLRATKARRSSEAMTYREALREKMSAPAAVRAAAGGSLTAREREWIAGYLFVLPGAIGLLVFVGAPMVLALSLGFIEVSGFGGYRFVGLANYRRMLADPLFPQSLRVTRTYVMLLVPSLYVAGLGLALLIQRGGRISSFF